jgi:DNA transposition AAA+ family ATPase
MTLESIDGGRAARGGAVTESPGSFVATSNAAEVFKALDSASMHREIAVIYGPTGVGKSAALDAYTLRRRSALLVSAGVGDTKPVPMLRTVARACAIAYSENLGLADLFRTIRDRAPEGALLIVDNAQALSREVLAHLASLVDSGSGGRQLAVALVGREDIHALVFGTGRATERFNMSWVASRVGPRLYIKTVPAADVEAVAATYGVQDRETLDLLHQLSGRRLPPNLLWAVTRVLRLAQSNAGGKAIRPDHVRAAARMLGDQVIGD